MNLTTEVYLLRIIVAFLIACAGASDLSHPAVMNKVEMFLFVTGVAASGISAVIAAVALKRSFSLGEARRGEDWSGEARRGKVWRG